MEDRDSKGINTTTRDLNTIIDRNQIKGGILTFAKYRKQFNVGSFKCFRKSFSKTSTSPMNTQLHTRV